MHAFWKTPKFAYCCTYIDHFSSPLLVQSFTLRGTAARLLRTAPETNWCPQPTNTHTNSDCRRNGPTHHAGRVSLRASACIRRRGWFLAADARRFNHALVDKRGGKPELHATTFASLTYLSPHGPIRARPLADAISAGHGAQYAATDRRLARILSAISKVTFTRPPCPRTTVLAYSHLNRLLAAACFCQLI